MRYLQDDVVGQLPRVMQVPAEFVFTGLEGLAIQAIDKATRPRETGVSADDLLEQVRNLRAQNAQLAGMLAEANVRLAGVENLRPIGLSAGDTLAATVVGEPYGPGTSRIHLDKGAAHGVRQGMAVVAPLEQVTLLGRVVTVGQIECEVMLLTDPAMRVQADIVRDAGTSITDKNRTCIVQGMGANQMRTQDVDVDRGGLPEPARGDFVRLVDRSWPMALQFMSIGVLDEVRVREDQAKRYDLRIVPLRPVTSVRTVMVVKL
jgi:hypothetical protein